MANANFGTVVPEHAGPEWVTGWGKRPYNWQMSVIVDREVTSNLVVNVGYYHTTYGNFYVLDNTLVAPTDYSPYCVTAPTDPRLLGQRPAALRALRPEPEQVRPDQSIVTRGSNYGKQTEIYDGVDVNSRASREAATLGGGWNIGNAVQTGTTAGGTAGSGNNNCFVGRLAAAAVQLRDQRSIPEPRQDQRVVPVRPGTSSSRGSSRPTRARPTTRTSRTRTRRSSRRSAGRCRAAATTRSRSRRAAVRAYGPREPVRPARRQDLPVRQPAAPGEHGLYNVFNFNLRDALRDLQRPLGPADAGARRTPGEIQLQFDF